jgi:hypothetical protein
LWWWALLVAIFVIVGWASGSAETGKTVAEYFGLTVVVLVVVALLVSGFVEQRTKRRQRE